MLDSENLKFWINVALVAVSLNIIDAILVDVGVIGHNAAFNTPLYPVFSIKPHIPALVIAIGVLLAGAVYLFRFHVRRMRRP